MSATITLPRAVVEQVREAFKELDYASEPYVNEIARTALAALDAALAEPDVADLFARFAAKQKPLDADMAAILHANLDSLYITEDALREGIDAQDRDLWQRRADEEVLKEYEKRYGKPEPVAFWHRDKGFYWAKPTEIHMDTITVVPPLALYAAPPQPDAKREPATREQVAEAYIAPDIEGRWADFEAAFRAAERFHGIVKEDK